MSDLADALIASFGTGFDKAAEERLNSVFLNNRQNWIHRAVEDYMRYNTDPNQNIAKVAQQYDLNDQQIRRLVEETNVQIYLQKYAGVKTKDVRRVEFELADFNKIASALGKTPTTEDAEKAANIADVLIEKAASAASTVDFLTNSASYEPSLWDANKVDQARVELARKAILVKTAEVAEAQYQLAKSTLHKIAQLGDALINLEYRGVSAQTVFTKIAQEVKMPGEYQDAIAKYVVDKVASMKEERMLPKNLNLTLEKVALESEEAPSYSLGKHSLLSKVASFDENSVNLADGKSYATLVTLASEISSNLTNPILHKETPVEIATKQLISEGAE